MLTFLLILFELLNYSFEKSVEDERGVKLPNKCEVCKYVAFELQHRVEETGKIRDKLKIGYNLMEPENYKVKDYKRSELRLIEIMEGICDNILKYNVHKERQGSLRYAKGQSETMSTLHGLRNRGVKVDLGIPEELWDSPSAEITDMKRKCETMMETHMDNIEAWYFNFPEKSMINYLCKENVLSKNEQECLEEKWTGKEKVDFSKESTNESSKSEGKGKKKSGKKKANKNETNKINHDQNLTNTTREEL